MTHDKQRTHYLNARYLLEMAEKEFAQSDAAALFFAPGAAGGGPGESEGKATDSARDPNLSRANTPFDASSGDVSARNSLPRECQAHSCVGWRSYGPEGEPVSIDPCEDCGRLDENEATSKAWASFGALFEARYGDDWDGALGDLEDILSQFAISIDSSPENRKHAVDLNACLAGLRFSMKHYLDRLEGIEPAVISAVPPVEVACGECVDGWVPDMDKGIQRCDTCKRFPDDHAARAHVAEVLRTLHSCYGDGSEADGVVLPHIKRALREDVEDDG